MRILVTGASGYVGSYLLPYLAKRDIEIIAVVRELSPENEYLSEFAELIAVGDLTKEDFTLAIEVDCVIHLAGRAHVMNDSSQNPFEAYRQGNVEVTRKLLNWAEKRQVNRFVYISSIKALGEETYGEAYTEESQCFPEDDYGKTKLEAEELVMEKCASTGMDYVIARPCLIYGKQLVGNLKSLSRITELGIPLPFKAVQNKRAMLDLSLFSRFLYASVLAPGDIRQLYLIADKCNYSLAQILTVVANGKKPNLFTFPERLLRLGFNLPGLKGIGRRLLNDLEVDASKSHQFMETVLEGKK